MSYLRPKTFFGIWLDGIRYILIVFVATVFLESALFRTSSVAAQSCQQYIMQQYLVARTNASQCGISSSTMGAIESPSPAPRSCERGARAVMSQLGAFQACAAVYFCASEAYRCAFRQVSSGVSCETAMRACLNENPIPQIQ